MSTARPRRCVSGEQGDDGQQRLARAHAERKEGAGVDDVALRTGVVRQQRETQRADGQRDRQPVARVVVVEALEQEKEYRIAGQRGPQPAGGSSSAA